MRRFLSILMAVVLCISVLSVGVVSVSAANEGTAASTNKYAKPTGFDWSIESGIAWATVDTKVYNKASTSSGVSFTLSKEKPVIIKSAVNNNWWYVDYYGSKGYVQNVYFLVDLWDCFTPAGKTADHHGVYADITNNYKNIYTYRSKNNTHKYLYGSSRGRLYDWDQQFIPVNYHTAVMIGKAKAALPSKLRLKIYDTYRPYSVSKKVAAQFDKIINSGDYNLNGANKGDLLSQLLSFHNTGSALDVTLTDVNGNEWGYSINGKEATKSRIHELSGNASVSQNLNLSKKIYDGETLSYWLNYAFMKKAGMQGLRSEWWHFQDSVSRDAIAKAAGIYYGYYTSDGYWSRTGSLANWSSSKALKNIAQTIEPYYNTPKVSAVVNNGNVKVSWSNVGAPYYRLYKKVNGSWKGILDTKSTSYIDKDIKPDTIEQYTVRALYSDKEWASEFKPFTLHIYEDPVMKGISSTSEGLKLSWTPISGLTMRAFYKNSSGSWVRLGDSTNGVINDIGVAIGESRTYTLRWVGSDGNYVSGHSIQGWSATRSFIAPKLNSEYVYKSKIKDGDGGYYDLSEYIALEGITGAEGETVYVRKNKTGSFVKLDSSLYQYFAKYKVDGADEDYRPCIVIPESGLNDAFGVDKNGDTIFQFRTGYVINGKNYYSKATTVTLKHDYVESAKFVYDYHGSYVLMESGDRLSTIGTALARRNLVVVSNPYRGDKEAPNPYLTTCKYVAYIPVDNINQYCRVYNLCLPLAGDSFEDLSFADDGETVYKQIEGIDEGITLDIDLGHYINPPSGYELNK